MNYYQSQGGDAVEENLFELLQREREKKELFTLVSVNEKTERFGLSLSEEQAKELMICRDETLRKYKRVEFGSGILDKLVFTFCDSQYIEQDSYLEIMEQLQEIFYEFKNESQDLLTDDELLTFMKEQFETVCYGDTEYLEGTCLEIFTEAVRAGYRGYEATGGKGEFAQLDEVPRWDKELYLEVLRELCWR